MDSINSCKDLIDGLPKKIEGMNCFSIGRTETSAYIQSFEYVPSTGIPKFSLVIENDFTYEAFHHGVKCNIATLSANRIYTLNKWPRIQESVRFLKDKQVSNKKIVLAEHVAALVCTKVGRKNMNLLHLCVLSNILHCHVLLVVNCVMTLNCLVFPHLLD